MSCNKWFFQADEYVGPEHTVDAHADGLFLTDNPQRLAQEGKIANIPFVIGIVTPPVCISTPHLRDVGACEDEGTLFSLANLNITFVFVFICEDA